MQEVRLQGLWLEYAHPAHFWSMWEAFSKLPKLRSLYYQTGDGTIPIDPAQVDQSAPRLEFFHQLHRVTQIK